MCKLHKEMRLIMTKFPAYVFRCMADQFAPSRRYGLCKIEHLNQHSTSPEPWFAPVTIAPFPSDALAQSWWRSVWPKHDEDCVINFAQLGRNQSVRA
jgi:hypothetical protein